MQSRLISKVPSSHQKDGIRWLLLEPNAHQGWFLFGHRTLEDRSVFDSWHLTRFEAEREAALQWGVNGLDWSDT